MCCRWNNGFVWQLTRQITYAARLSRGVCFWVNTGLALAAAIDRSEVLGELSGKMFHIANRCFAKE